MFIILITSNLTCWKYSFTAMRKVKLIQDLQQSTHFCHTSKPVIFGEFQHLNINLSMMKHTYFLPTESDVLPLSLNSVSGTTMIRQCQTCIQIILSFIEVLSLLLHYYFSFSWAPSPIYCFP